MGLVSVPSTGRIGPPPQGGSSWEDCVVGAAIDLEEPHDFRIHGSEKLRAEPLRDPRPTAAPSSGDREESPCLALAQVLERLDFRGNDDRRTHVVRSGLRLEFRFDGKRIRGSAGRDRCSDVKIRARRAGPANTADPGRGGGFI